MHSFAISLLKACTEKCHWIHLRRSLFPSLSFCLFVSHSVFFPSIPHFIFASCLHWYQSVSSVFVNLSLSLHPTNLFTFSFLSFSLSPLFMFTTLRFCLTQSSTEKDWRQDKNTETEVWWRLKRAVHNIVRHSFSHRRHSGIQKMHFPSSNPESLF